ncbi:MAG: hypothetical protein MJE68_25790, partial [Proteobacteria bacterium]|nr:hypothetical protein [Pseudomonadota bacterium]
FVLKESPGNYTIAPSAASATYSVLDDDPVLQITSLTPTLESGGVPRLTVFTDIPDSAVNRDHTVQLQYTYFTLIPVPDMRVVEESRVLARNANSTTFDLPQLADDFVGSVTASIVTQHSPTASDYTAYQVAADATNQTVINVTPPPVVPSVSVADPAEVDEGETITFTITLNETTTVPVTVDYIIDGGDAINPDDYTTPQGHTGTVTFAPNTDTQRVSVTTIRDNLAGEGAETFHLTLRDPVNATLADPAFVATATIQDTTQPPTISVAGPTQPVDEGDNATFTISLAGSTSLIEVTVDYNTEGTPRGTATEGEDYNATSGTATIPAGQNSVDVNVTIASDDVANERGETIILTISNPVHATLGTPTEALATITDTTPVPEISVGDITLDEATSKNFTISLNATHSGDVTVEYTFTTGNATEADYSVEAASGVATITAGDTNVNLTINASDDRLANEGDETVILTLSTPVNATLADPTATATITDIDLPPDVFIRTGTISVFEGGTASYAIRLSNRSAKEVTVTYATGAADDSDNATAGEDYTPVTGSVTLPANVLEDRFVTVQTLRDSNITEGNETFTFRLTSATGATLDGVNFKKPTTIKDFREPDPTVSITAPTSPVTINEGDTTTVTVTLNQTSIFPLDIGYRLEGNATLADDYTVSNGTDPLTSISGIITIPANTTSASITITALNDEFTDGGDEEVILTLRDTEGVVVDTNANTASITIADTSTTPIVELGIYLAEGPTAAQATSLAQYEDALDADTLFIRTANNTRLPANLTVNWRIVQADDLLMDRFAHSGREIRDAVVVPGGATQSGDITIGDDTHSATATLPASLFANDANATSVTAKLVKGQIGMFVGIRFRADTNDAVDSDTRNLTFELLAGDGYTIASGEGRATFVFHDNDPAYSIAPVPVAVVGRNPDNIFTGESANFTISTTTSASDIANDHTVQVRFTDGDGNALAVTTPTNPTASDTIPVTLAANENSKRLEVIPPNNFAGTITATITQNPAGTAPSTLYDFVRDAETASISVVTPPPDLTGQFNVRFTASQRSLEWASSFNDRQIRYIIAPTSGGTFSDNHNLTVRLTNDGDIPLGSTILLDYNDRVASTPAPAPNSNHTYVQEFIQGHARVQGVFTLPNSNNDQVDEESSNFTVEVLNGRGEVIAHASHLILDDDPAINLFVNEEAGTAGSNVSLRVGSAAGSVFNAANTVYLEIDDPHNVINQTAFTDHANVTLDETRTTSTIYNVNATILAGDRNANLTIPTNLNAPNANVSITTLVFRGLNDPITAYRRGADADTRFSVTGGATIANRPILRLQRPPTSVTYLRQLDEGADANHIEEFRISAAETSDSGFGVIGREVAITVQVTHTGEAGDNDAGSGNTTPTIRFATNRASGEVQEFNLPPANTTETYDITLPASVSGGSDFYNNHIRFLGDDAEDEATSIYRIEIAASTNNTYLLDSDPANNGVEMVVLDDDPKLTITANTTTITAGASVNFTIRVEGETATSEAHDIYLVATDPGTVLTGVGTAPFVAATLRAGETETSYIARVNPDASAGSEFALRIFRTTQHPPIAPARIAYGIVPGSGSASVVVVEDRELPALSIALDTDVGGDTLFVREDFHSAGGVPFTFVITPQAQSATPIHVPVTLVNTGNTTLASGFVTSTNPDGNLTSQIQVPPPNGNVTINVPMSALATSATIGLFVQDDDRDGPGSDITATIVTTDTTQPTSAIATIIDDDPAISVSADSRYPLPGDTVNVTFSVPAPVANPIEISLGYGIADPTLVTGDSMPRTATIARGETNVTIPYTFNSAQSTTGTLVVLPVLNVLANQPPTPYGIDPAAPNATITVAPEITVSLRLINEGETQHGIFTEGEVASETRNSAFDKDQLHYELVINPPLEGEAESLAVDIRVQHSGRTIFAVDQNPNQARLRFNNNSADSASSRHIEIASPAGDSTHTVTLRGDIDSSKAPGRIGHTGRFTMHAFDRTVEETTTINVTILASERYRVGADNSIR